MDILIIDDDFDLLEILKDSLTDFSVMTASAPKEALSLVESGRPKIVMIDVEMPEMNGFLLCQKITEEYPDPTRKVVFMSGNTLETTKYNGYKAGAIDYITKPFRVNELNLKLKALLDQISSAQNLVEKNLELAEKTNELLNLMNKREEQMIRLGRLSDIGMLTSQIAHNLKNIFSVIVGYAERVRKKHGDEELASKLVQLVERANDIVNSSLLYESQSQYRTRDYNINHLIEKELKFYSQNHFSRKKLILNLQLGELPNLNGNSSEISQVIANLISNALDAMNELDQPTLSITTQLDPIENTVVITISDNGVGIESEHLDKIFDPFFTTKNDPKKKQQLGGTGLGLAFVKRVIESNGGLISVTSIKDKGTTFTLILPVTKF